MKSAKAMKKVKKVSILAKGRAAKAAVFSGRKAKTVGGLTKAKLIKSKAGKIVSKAASASAKKNWAKSPLKKWGVTGFCAVGGKTAKGKALYAKAKAILAGK